MLNSPEAAAVQAPRGKIVEALVRMGKAVQKATIYPEGHPAIPGAVETFLEALPQALEDTPSLSIGIAVDRFLLDGEPLDEKGGILAWLAERLHERGLAAIDLGRNLPEADAVRFVRWLATPAGLKADEEFGTSFEGMVLTKFDYTRARFGEDPAAGDAVENDTIRAWHSMMSGMAAGCGIDMKGWVSGDPQALAKEVNAAIEAGEGPDASSLTSRVISMGGTLPSLSAPVRDAVKARLGAFIGGLTPELRTQLLRVDPGTSRQKIEFVADMVDALPKSTVVEVLGSLDKQGAHVPHQFITLMNKLIGLAERNDPLKQTLGSRLESIGVPRSLMDTEPDRMREVLTEVMQSRIEVTWNPGRYQALLEDLSSRRVEGSAPPISERFGDPCDEKGVSAHVSEIALRLLTAGPEAPEAQDFLRCLEEDAPRAFESGRFGQVQDAATAVREVKEGPSPLSPELMKQLETYLSGFTREERIAKILAAAAAGPSPIPPEIVGLFKISGAAGALGAFQALAAPAEGPGRERVTELLVQSEPDAFMAAIGRLRTEGWTSLRVLFPVLHRIGAPRGVELSLTFVGNEDHRIRVEALRVLLALDRREGQLERYVERALADESPRVAAFAISHARHRGGPELTSLLGAFLCGVIGGPEDQELRVQAIHALASFRTCEARDILISRLSGRKIALWVKDVSITSALEESLVQIGDETSMKAVRAWRRSAARWLSLLLVAGKVKTR